MLRGADLKPVSVPKTHGNGDRHRPLTFPSDPVSTLMSHDYNIFVDECSASYYEMIAKVKL